LGRISAPMSAMEIPTPQQSLFSRINEFTKSIEILLDAGHSLSALIVLYTAVDIFGSTLRPETEPDTAGCYFKKWVDDYMIAGSQLPFVSDDLWGARCALLHTHTTSSKLSRAGKARELHYYRSYGRPVPPAMQTALGSLSPKGKQFLDLDAMHGAFVDGTRRFIVAIQRDPALEKRVLHHSRMLLGSWSSPA